MEMAYSWTPLILAGVTVILTGKLGLLLMWIARRRRKHQLKNLAQLRRHDGILRQFLCRVVPVRDQARVVCPQCGTLANIAEQQDDAAAFEARFAERTADLQCALARLEEEAAKRARAEDALRQSQKMEAIGQLTVGVAHDFNNLLTVVISGTDVLRRPGLTEGRRLRYINAIGDAAERAARLTSQVLAFARQQPLCEVALDAAESVRRIVEMLTHVVGSRIALTTILRLSPATVQVDLVQFETALVNLAVNARDAVGGEGSIVLTVDACSEIPAARGQPAIPGTFVKVSITDDGVGLAEHEMACIFEPYYTTKAVGKGTGLGLSQVYGFAKRSGGEVRVESAPGQGATFSLYLPQASPSNVSLEPAPNTELTNEHATGRVLIVEDDESLGSHTVHLLSDLGYEAALAPNASSALKILEEGAPFNLVLTEVALREGMSGLGLARELARTNPELPVVLTTGRRGVLAGEGAHGIELLRKPYSLDTLGTLCRRVIASPVGPG